MENTLDAEQSLRLISDTLAKTKDNFAQNSFYFMLWGWLVASASFGTYLLMSLTTINFPYLPFPLLAAVGITTTIWYFQKQRNSNSTETYLNYYLNRMWIVLGFSFFLAVFISLQNGLQPFSYTLMIAGIGTMVTGLTTKFRPLQVGGILFFVMAIISVFVSKEIQPLLHGFAIIAGYLIPGYLLNRSKN